MGDGQCGWSSDDAGTYLELRMREERYQRMNEKKSVPFNTPENPGERIPPEILNIKDSPCPPPRKKSKVPIPEHVNVEMNLHKVNISNWYYDKKSGNWQEKRNKLFITAHELLNIQRQIQ